MTKEKHSPARWLRLIGLVTLLGLTAYGFAPAQGAGPGSATVQSKASSAVVTRPTLRKDFKPGSALSAKQYRILSKELYTIRKQMAPEALSAGGAESAIPLPEAAQTVPEAAARFHGTPSSLLIGRNNFNNRANTNTCGTGSVLAEPAAANEGPNVYYSGNLRHQEFSTNGGATYNCAAAYPAGPAEAPFAFGDTDVIYDHSRGVTFHSVLYVNSNLTNGVIRIFVRRNIPFGDNCFYHRLGPHLDERVGRLPASRAVQQLPVR